MNRTFVFQTGEPVCVFAACWRRLRPVRKDALRSGTAADKPDRTRVWLQHDVSSDSPTRSWGHGLSLPEKEVVSPASPEDRRTVSEPEDRPVWRLDGQHVSTAAAGKRRRSRRRAAGKQAEDEVSELPASVCSVSGHHQGPDQVQDSLQCHRSLIESTSQMWIRQTQCTADAAPVKGDTCRHVKQQRMTSSFYPDLPLDQLTTIHKRGRSGPMISCCPTLPLSHADAKVSYCVTQGSGQRRKRQLCVTRQGFGRGLGDVRMTEDKFLYKSG
ncbi:hypothetical protein F2P81_025668 [Scophthalmus maximus]|uniref:Uncharacterized protein n=1 Tax=Scophthalmus maximus TaxID=52904 RepID=A0A6A4RP56_SCOMX|nr:hypothetical protein F2P81_025668 [Scophthalmus maximus]